MGTGLVGFLFLSWISLGVNGEESSFFTDIISTFKLRSPTIIYHGETPEICMRQWWVLCLDLEYRQEIVHKEKGTWHPEIMIYNNEYVKSEIRNAAASGLWPPPLILYNPPAYKKRASNNYMLSTRYGE